MSEWKESLIGSFINIQNGYAFKSGDFKNSSGIPVIKIKNVASGKLDLTDVQYYDGSINDKENFIIKKGDILIAMTGSHVHQSSSMVGRVVRYDLEQIALLNQRVGKIYSLDKNILNEDFLYQFYRQEDVTYELALNAGGSANQANISPTLIKSLSFPKPPLPVQIAIAGVLNSMEDKIDLLHRQNKTLEAMAETLFRQWFVEEADESWEEKKLDVVVDIGIGRTPPRKEFDWFSTNLTDVKWVSIKDMGDRGVYILSTNELLTSEAINKFNIPIIPQNTVLLSFKMTVGRVAISSEEMLSNEAIAHFKFNPTTPFTKEYLYLFLKTFKYDLLGSTSSIVTSINSAMIKEMEIKIPDKKNMGEFQQVTELYFNKILINQKQIRTLEKLRDTLLPKLMSGEVRVRYNEN
jgi:type I restriction enzyme, S subunit